MKGSGDFGSRLRAEAVSDSCPHIERLVACEACIAQAIEDAVRAEREACASTADAFYGDDGGHIAELIRARGAADPTPGEERGR